MSINRVVKNNLAKITHPQLTLKPGQIVQGKIIKIYPDNKAQIQLGSQKLIAQLEASLTIGERYHFQVQTTDDLIHLKVLGEQLNNEERINSKNLLHQLGLRATKSNATFMQSLINEKIPFDNKQLANAFQLLDSSKQNKTQSQQVLREMFAAKLPITDSVFQALHTKNTSGITEQMKAMLQSLKQDTNQSQLVERLSQMVERPLNTHASLVKQVITENDNNNRQLFNLLKASGSIDTSIDLSTWNKQWETFGKQNNVTPTNISNQQLSSIKLPFQMDGEIVYQALEKMVSNKVGIQNHSHEIIHLWGSKLTQLVTKNTVLPEQEFSELKQQIQQKIMPLLTQEQQQQFTKNLQNNPLQLRQLLTSLQTLSYDQNFTKMEQLLANMNSDKTFLLAAPKEQFLTQMNQMLRFTGLAYENHLMNSVLEQQQQSNTVKGMLLQMLQHTDDSTHERGRQLLHFINGMQINSVHEVNNFVQASLQIPGEKLGLNNDLELEFEGKKTDKGEINPDFCRIIFYLDLAYLKTTVIDMNINKRAVAVTVFNDFHQLREQSPALQPLLKEGLESLNYTLSMVTFKPLEQKNEPKATKRNISPQGTRAPHEGVDYRI